MNILPPKKRKENRRSVEEPRSHEETSSCTSDSTSPTSSSPIPDLVGFSSSLSSSSIPEVLEAKVSKRKRNVEEEDDQSEEEIESRINDLSLLNGRPLNSGNLENVQQDLDQDQARALVQMMTQKIFRPVMTPLFRHPFFPPQYVSNMCSPSFLLPSLRAHMERAPLSTRPFFLRPSQVSQLNTDENKRSLKNRDSQKASEHVMTISEIDQVVSMPPEEFQDHCQQRCFSEDQTKKLKDLRRRGKNKVAAQKCRKRKLDEIRGYTIKIEAKQKEILIGEITLRENQEEKQQLVDKFGELKKELEDHKKETLGCSEHSEFTKSCLGKTGCKITIITVRLIRS